MLVLLLKLISKVVMLQAKIDCICSSLEERLMLQCVTGCCTVIACPSLWRWLKRQNYCSPSNDVLQATRSQLLYTIIKTAEWRFI